MLVRNLVIAAALTASALVSLPTSAQAGGDERGWQREHDDDDDDDDDDRGRYRNARYQDVYYDDRPTYYRGRESEPRRDYRDARSRQGCRTKGTTGLIVGGAAGALLGRELDRYGSRTPGTIIGAGASGLAAPKEVDATVTFA